MFISNLFCFVLVFGARYSLLCSRITSIGYIRTSRSRRNFSTAAQESLFWAKMADLPKDFYTSSAISSEYAPLRPIRRPKWHFPIYRQEALMEARWLKLTPIIQHKFVIRKVCSSLDMRTVLRAYLQSCCQCGETVLVCWNGELLPASCLSVEVVSN